MMMVEVKDDKNVDDKAPDDAKKLSDKNRDVAEETRATETNLDKESEGKAESRRRRATTRTSAEIGGPDDKIRQLEDTKPTTDKRIEETDHSGKERDREGRDRARAATTARRAPATKDARRAVDARHRRPRRDHRAGARRQEGRQARACPASTRTLAFQDYERIMGKDKVDDERQVAARKMSSKKGRWERKLDAIKSSLENFVPDVRAGNQTALKTRAHPFALYVARMHRRIHELWGFGFLEDRSTTRAPTIRSTIPTCGSTSSSRSTPTARSTRSRSRRRRARPSSTSPRSTP